ncbi:phosphoribosylformylglycinamidine synthase subunit PurL [Bryobacter aggregatus]|uniref:phosphoribosylformylglycinamidine synthase subunit PurL n=1 Tax=Bryobacter aggregatus TaxID=360054 RepID=UPI0004E1872F|nr:phosphoribosylformylglycinamidine synthase subunit PurL [Bryobacter aggregatus]
MTDTTSTTLDALLKKHKLTQGEYEKIIQLLGREPNLTELGIFSVMWSEHCSYKSSKVHLKKLPTESARVLQGPGENAGIIDIGGGYAIAFKIESHNHPSFIEPFQGAATGVGGILRDIFTMGARPIAVLDAIRFGPLDSKENGARNRRILDGVVQGISHYGNCFGVPTIGGETAFEACYDGNPLVNVFALGVFRHDEIFYGRATGVGNPVIYVGGRTGRDGIAGASMASDVFTEASQQQRPTVQVGDPFMEKLLLEACIEAMKTGAVVGIQDMGAAGLTCSTSEMGSRAETGIDFDLKHVPQRETGMTPYEIMLSESQERMLLVAEKGREQEIFDVFNKWGLESATIGTVTDDGMLRVRNNGVVVAEIRNRDLADEAPLYNRPYTKPFRSAPMEGPAFQSKSLEGDLLKMLASNDLCSKKWIWEQYDYMVRTNTLAGPGGDAAIVRIKEAGISVAMSLDGNGRYCYLDPREGVKLIVAECCRNLSVVGAQPVSATNNLNFGNPERPEIMAQLVEAIEGMSDACRFFETPITGGNVSLYNETLGESIFPTPVIGIVGLLPTAKPVPSAFPAAGLDVLLLGGLGDCDLTHFGGTQYAKQVLDQLWGLPPKLDMEFEKRVQSAAREIALGGLAAAAHDLGEGGLAVALAECSFGGVGAAVEIASELRPEFTLFHEAPSRVLVATSKLEEVLAVAARHDVPAVILGKTASDTLKISISGQPAIEIAIDRLYKTWDQALEEALHV